MSDFPEGIHNSSFLHPAQAGGAWQRLSQRFQMFYFLRAVKSSFANLSMWFAPFPPLFHFQMLGCILGTSNSGKMMQLQPLRRLRLVCTQR